MASGGLRLGGFVGLRDGSVRPIYDDKTGKLLAAQVTVYGGTSDEYDTFITPETYSTYEQYRNLRHKEWMMGHALRDLHAMEENYDRSDRVKILLEDYMKAVPELTISDEERLKVEVKKLKTDISNMRSLSVELDEKDKQIETLREEHEVKMEAMREEMKQQYSKIMSLIQQNPVLAHVKPEVLTKKMQ